MVDLVEEPGLQALRKDVGALEGLVPEGINHLRVAGQEVPLGSVGIQVVNLHQGIADPARGQHAPLELERRLRLFPGVLALTLGASHPGQHQREQQEHPRKVPPPSPQSSSGF